jgi:hypothetical protein
MIGRNARTRIDGDAAPGFDGCDRLGFLLISLTGFVTDIDAELGATIPQWKSTFNRIVTETR